MTGSQVIKGYGRSIKGTYAGLWCGWCGQLCPETPDGMSLCEWRALVLPVIEVGFRVCLAIEDERRGLRWPKLREAA